MKIKLKKFLSIKVQHMIIFCSLFAASNLLAALPPLAESLRRISAITESQDVYDSLGTEQFVKSITLTSNGNYLISTTNCTLEVNVKADTTGSEDSVPDLTVLIGKKNCALPK